MTITFLNLMQYLLLAPLPLIVLLIVPRIVLLLAQYLLVSPLRPRDVVSAAIEYTVANPCLPYPHTMLPQTLIQQQNQAYHIKTDLSILNKRMSSLEIRSQQY